jgi:hypothetical protein
MQHSEWPESSEKGRLSKANHGLAMVQFDLGLGAGSRKDLSLRSKDRFSVAVIPHPSAGLRIKSGRDIAKLKHQHGVQQVDLSRSFC